ncbi:hypothetical protein GCM10023317_93420 [Actinopolymorpha pittospori]|uniref:Transposase n=1 Tax=Actinopolymorpha pittospori TaxID=648752 RepID=A0A927MXL3_9ACTN|nr:putative transposase [Actinopolymorpha pittospori]
MRKLIGQAHERQRLTVVFGARKMWLHLRGQGHDVARCTIERLYRQHGIEGARRGGKKPLTTQQDQENQRSPDLVNRNFTAPAPNRLWVADFTYVPTWNGMVYVAFVFDVFSRAILGWRAATSMKTDLVLDALEMAIWARGRHGRSDLSGLVYHTDAGSQYTSIAFTTRLSEAGAAPSVGSVGDAYDNALAESQIGLYKTELIGPQGPWRDLDHVEIATLDWIHWFNTDRPHESLDDLTPAQVEQIHYAHRDDRTKTAA